MGHPPFIASAKIAVVSVAVVAVFLGLMGRLYYLHVSKQEEFRAYAERSRTSFTVLDARRGDILDQRGNLLATTRSHITLGFDPLMVQLEDGAKLAELMAILGDPAEDLRRAIQEGWRPMGANGRPLRWLRLHDGLDEEQFQAVMDLRIRGVYGNRRYQRHYPGGPLAAHLLGFVNREEVPVFGVERDYHFYLRGQRGWRETEVDGRRRELSVFREREVQVRPGFHLQLTIDVVAQSLVEREIEKLVAEFSPESVSVIVSRTGTGDILALANYPTVDLNHYGRIPVDHHRNRAITDVFEPGSTFKVVPIAGALNEGRVRPDTAFDCDLATFQYQNRTIRLPRDHRRMGTLDVENILVQSSNRGAAMVAMTMGGQSLYDYARRFGFGEPTGLNLGGEVRGTLHPVNRWDGLTISRLPMGHAVSATPLQVHQSMAVIANQGALVEPRLVRRVVDDAGEPIVEFPVRVRRQVLEPEVARTVALFLRDVVGENGTAQRAAIGGFNAAGKTGTTQMIVNGAYSSNHHVASFSGFFPAEDPQVVITVVVVDPRRDQGTAYGGWVAAPAFGRIGEELSSYLRIRPASAPSGMMARAEN